MEHYKRETGWTTDRRRVQPKGQQLNNHIRHKTEQICKVPPYIQARPIRPQADNAAAELTRRVIEGIISNPRKRYRGQRRRMVQSGLAGGRGCIAIEWDARAGLCFRVADPRKVFICPGFTDLHDPRNPYVIEEIPMRLSALRACKALGWNIPDDLRPDNYKPEAYAAAQQDTSRIDFDYAGNQNLPGASDGSEADGIVTIIRCYYRWDPLAQKKDGPVPLPVEEWLYRDELSGATVKYDGNAAPMSEISGNPYKLVTTQQEKDSHYAYPDGYMCVVAPFYSGQAPLWEGGWLPGAPNKNVVLQDFPYMQFVCNLHPGRVAGKSDTELNATLQIVDDASFRAAWEQMRVAQGILIAQRGALEGQQEGQPFQFSDSPMQQAWAVDRMGMEGIKFFQAPGMNSALPAFRQMLERQWSYIGNGDVQVPSGNSKNIPVGTIDALMQQGDLPVMGHLETLQAEESIGFRVAYDLERAYMGQEAMISWVSDTGDSVYAQVRPEDLVDSHVVVIASPDQHKLDVDRIQAVAQFAGQVASAQLPPEWLPVLAKSAGFSPEINQIFTKMAAASQSPKGPDKPLSSDAQMITAIGSLYKNDPSGQVAAAVVQALSNAGLLSGPASPGAGDGAAARPPLQLVPGGNQ